MKTWKRYLAGLSAMLLFCSELGGSIAQAAENTQDAENKGDLASAGSDIVLELPGETSWNTEQAAYSIAYSARITAPGSDNSWYYSADNIFYSIYGTTDGADGGSQSSPGAVGMAWYAYGRASEILGEKAGCGIDSQGEALLPEGWYSNTGDGYSRGSEPKLGAIACKGTHVAVVEAIDSGKNTMTLSSAAGVGRGFYMSYNQDCTAYSYIYLNDEFSAATAEPTITAASVSDVNPSGGTYKVTATIQAPAGLSRVQFPAWTADGGQDDLIENWSNDMKVSGSVTSLGGDTYKAVYVVNTADHNREYGVYNTQVYAYDTLGRSAKWECAPVDMGKVPTITKVEIKNVNYTTGLYTVYVYVDDPAAVARVQFPTWTEKNGQDDLAENWETDTSVSGTRQDGSNFWSYTVKRSDHNGEEGNYITNIYVYNTAGQYAFYKLTMDLSKPISGVVKGTSISWELAADGTLTISGKGTMPDSNTLSEVGAWASYLDQVKRVVVNDGITVVQGLEGASNLASVTLPSTVEEIGGFGDCVSLKGTLVLPENVKQIQESAFQGTGITDVVFTGKFTERFAGRFGDLDADGVKPPFYPPQEGEFLPSSETTEPWEGDASELKPSEEKYNGRSYLKKQTSYILGVGTKTTKISFIAQLGSFPDNTIIHYPESWKEEAGWDSTQSPWSGYVTKEQQESESGDGSYDYGMSAGGLPLGITLDQSSLHFVAGDGPKRLTANILPADASDKAVLWKSSDENVAVVDTDGLVTPQGEGIAYIYAYAGETEDSVLYAVCQVVVSNTLAVSFMAGESGSAIVVNGILPGATIALPPEPQREHYDFKGWYTKPQGGGAAFTQETKITDNLIVYAYFEAKKYTLTYDVNGGEALAGWQQGRHLWRALWGAGGISKGRI